MDHGGFRHTLQNIQRLPSPDVALKGSSPSTTRKVGGASVFKAVEAFTCWRDYTGITQTATKKKPASN